MIIIKSLVPKHPNMKGFNYFKYVKWMDFDTHVHVFKVVIQADSEIEGANIVNFFEFTFRNLDLDWCNNYLNDYPKTNFEELI